MANSSEGNLNWMYEGKNSSIDHEQYLLGKRITTLQEENEEDKGDFMPKTESSIGTGNVTVLEKLDYESKVREDPLFEIRKKEFEHRKELLSNPLKKKRIQTVLKRALEKDLKKSLMKKRRKDSSSESEDSSASSSSDSDEVEKKLSKKSLKDKHLREMLKKKLEKDLKGKKQTKRRSSSEGEVDRRKKHRRSSDRTSQSENKKHFNKKSHSSRRRSSSSSCGSVSPRREGHKKEGYGLINVKGENIERKQRKRRERRTPSPEPEKQRYVRKHKTGFSRKLSEKDLERRRQEMMSNATWRDDQRKGNIKKYSNEEKKEMEREEKIQKMKEMADEKGVKTKDFLHDMKLHSASVGSLSDTVRRKKHTLNKRL